MRPPPQLYLTVCYEARLITLKFFTENHQNYCGIDLHARSMYLCIQNQEGKVVLHRNMEAIHGGKAKNDRIDSRKIAALMRDGTFPMAYVYPAKVRATRDLLRRRNHLTRKRADLLSHIQNTNSQYNMEPFSANFSYKQNRVGVLEQFTDPDVRMIMEKGKPCPFWHTKQVELFTSF